MSSYWYINLFNINSLYDLSYVIHNSYSATHQHGSGECCHIHGWGKTASNQLQLDQFIALDKQKMAEDPAYKSIYPKGEETELFPSEMQATANYIQTDDVCKTHYSKLYK